MSSLKLNLMHLQVPNRTANLSTQYASPKLDDTDEFSFHVKYARTDYLSSHILVYQRQDPSRLLENFKHMHRKKNIPNSTHQHIFLTKLWNTENNNCKKF